jgi:exopolyphosphatase/guanosine-5'-triphosphate,3'-diphosphate pyrophosphatase
MARQIEKVAVIDVGSNSIRMVIYERSGGALLPYFNEKTMAALGRDLGQTGHLNPDGVSLALETFRRFQAILSSFGIQKVFAVATAAVREATDGEAFRRAAEQVLGVELRVLSGIEEGHLAAQGVALGLAGANGLVADLGGTSLELCPVRPDRVTPGETYALGPLARFEDDHLSLGKRRKLIRKILAQSDLLPVEGGQLYAVGGAWRNLAAVNMRLTGYPLGVIHATVLRREDLHRVIEAAQGARAHKAIRLELQQVAKKRYRSLLHATLVLDGLLHQSGLSEAKVSAYGLREGVAMDALGLAVANCLEDTAELYLRLTEPSRAFGRALIGFISPVTDGLKLPPDLIRVACLMADSGARMHPDHRAELVFDQILRAPVPGLDHPQRVEVALAVAFRYSSNFHLPDELGQLISHKARRRAEILGTAMRLGGAFSGRSGRLLERVSLDCSPGELTLVVRAEDHEMVSETVRRRLRQLAGLLDRKARLRNLPIS